MASPSVSIALIGKSYFLSAGGRNLAYDTADGSFQQALQHGPNVHHKYVALAADESYYIHYHDNAGRCHHTFSLESAYPGLDKHLDRIGVHCPKCVSLSPDGYYFMRSSWGTASSLPVALETDADGDAELEDVWFGKDDSYVAQNARGGWRWDLRGHYGSLGQTLKYGTKGIGSVGLNVTDGSFYIVLGMTELFSSIRAVAD